ncbi:MAG: hypothetical protein RLZ12_465 [Bacillota bacterium]|jgi:hypothetical protein
MPKINQSLISLRIKPLVKQKSTSYVNLFNYVDYDFATNDNTAPCIFTHNRTEIMKKGYTEMASINLNISSEAFIAEKEAADKLYKLSQ